MTRPIITDPNSILRQKGRALITADFNDRKINTLIADLIDTMYSGDGAGIAAPQIGESLQICVIAKNFTEEKERDLVLINPEWKKVSTDRSWAEEGCLSIPGIFGQVSRYNKIKVSAQDQRGKPLKFTAEDFFARVIQHEIDHLNGVLFIDKAKNLRRPEKIL